MAGKTRLFATCSNCSYPQTRPVDSGRGGGVESKDSFHAFAEENKIYDVVANDFGKRAAEKSNKIQTNGGKPKNSNGNGGSKLYRRNRTIKKAATAGGGA